MADRYRGPAITVPALTLESAPLDTSIAFGAADLSRIEVVVPDGHAGLTGFSLVIGRQQVIPEVEGEWIIANNETVALPMEGYPNSGAWVFRAWNEDRISHTFYLRMFIDNLAAPSRGLVPLVTPQPARAEPTYLPPVLKL